MSKFEDLEIKMQVLIFSYLDINSLLRCRLVNKEFLKNVSLVKIDSLYVDDYLESTQDYEPYYISKNFYTNDLAYSSNLLSTTNMEFYKSSFMKSILSNLKRLRIEETGESRNLKDFNLNDLNQFENLRQLELGLRCYEVCSILRLNNLRILCFVSISSAYGLSLDTPNLFAFKSYSPIINYKFLYPEKITYISFRKTCNFKAQLERFINLEYLSISLGESIPNFANLTHLKELHVKSIKPKILNSIWNQRKSNNLDFKVYLCGFRVDNNDDTKLFETELTRRNIDNTLTLQYRDDFSQFISSNYSRISEMMPYQCSNINYNYLIYNFKNNLPDDFHKKVTDIEFVSVKKTNSEIYQIMFAEFLRKAKTVTRLFIGGIQFSKAFYDDLYFNCPFLETLNLYHFDDLSIYLDFLSACKRLKNFEIDVPISLDIVKRTFDSLKYLKSFVFRFNDSDVKIHRIGNDFVIQNLGDVKFSDLDLILSTFRK